MEEHLLQVSHKQNWAQVCIFLLSQNAVLPESDAGSNVVEPVSSLSTKTFRTRAPCGARCMGHATAAAAWQCGKRVRPEKSTTRFVHGRMKSPNTSLQVIKINASCSALAHSNSPGTGLQYESTELGCTLTVLRVPSVIRPLRSSELSPERLLNRLCAAGKNGLLDFCLSWRASEHPLNI